MESGLPGGSDGKESACNLGDLGSIPSLERSRGGGHGDTLQYSNLENPMERGAWGVTVHGVTKGRPQPSALACIHAYLTKVEGKNLICC